MFFISLIRVSITRNKECVTGFMQRKIPVFTIKNHSNRLELKRRVTIGKTIDILPMDTIPLFSVCWELSALNPKNPTPRKKPSTARKLGWLITLILFLNIMRKEREIERRKVELSQPPQLKKKKRGYCGGPSCHFLTLSKTHRNNHGGLCDQTAQDHFLQMPLSVFQDSEKSSAAKGLLQTLEWTREGRTSWAVGPIR